jgi:ubiquinone/menaquinone biosynthesis C-methylase UbiE
VKRAAGAAELLDGPLDPATLRGNLRDLARINRWLGGVDLSRRAIRELAGAAWPQPAISVLDVGTGAADIPLDLLRTWGTWPALAVTALDIRSEVLDAARALRPELERTPGLVLALGTGRTLPFNDRAFDIAHSSLVLHHLDPPDAVAFLREQARVARLGVVVNDLSRAALHWAGAVAIGRCCTGNAYTRNDAPLSVRRSYTPSEVERLLRAAGLESRRVFRGLVRHRYAVIAVRPRSARRPG